MIISSISLPGMQTGRRRTDNEAADVRASRVPVHMHMRSPRKSGLARESDMRGTATNIPSYSHADLDSRFQTLWRLLFLTLVLVFKFNMSLVYHDAKLEVNTLLTFPSSPSSPFILLYGLSTLVTITYVDKIV